MVAGMTVRFSHADDETKIREIAVLLGEAAADRKVDLRESIHRVFAEIRPDPRVVLHYIGDLLTSDPDLAPTAPAVESFVRTAVAATALVETLTGDPIVHDDPDELFTSDDLLRIARVRGEVRRAIFSQPVLSSSGVARALGAPPTNREAARSLRARGDVIGFPHRGGFVYPAFQFDSAGRRVWPAVVRVNRLLDACHDPWGVAGWWLTPDRILDAEPFRLASNPDREVDLVAAAEAVSQDVG